MNPRESVAETVTAKGPAETADSGPAGNTGKATRESEERTSE